LNASSNGAEVESVVRHGAGFRIDASDCLTWISDGDRCSIKVRPHAEATSGLQTAYLAITWSGGDYPGQWVTRLNLSDTVEADSATASAVDFGTVPSGARSAVTTVQVSTSSQSPITLRGANVGATSHFRVMDDGCLAAGPSQGHPCSVSVTAIAGELDSDAFSGALRLSRTGPDGVDVYDVPLSATAATSELTSETSSVDFGAVMVNHQSGAEYVTATNSAEEPVHVWRSSILPGRGFRIISDGCAGRDIAPGDSCRVGLRAAPTVAGDANSGLYISFGGTGVNDGSQVAVALSASGVTQAITVSTLDGFGPAPVGSVTSVPHTVTVTNASGATRSFRATLPLSRHYTVASNTCNSVPDGETCTIGIAFSPKAVGTLQQNVVISYGSPTRVISRALSAVGTSAAVVQPTFATHLAGRAGAPVWVTVTNTTGIAQTIGTPALASASPAVASAFRISHAGFGTSVASGEARQVLVNNGSLTAGRFKDTLVLTIGEATVRVPLSVRSTTLSRGLVVNPVSGQKPWVNFADKVTTSLGMPATVTVANRTGASRAFVTSTLSANSEMSITADTCASHTIAKNATCVVTVKPLANATAGWHTATLTVKTSTNAYAVAVPLFVYATTPG
jgi:hypothetical protein